jgi:hypothetical protein
MGRTCIGNSRMVAVPVCLSEQNLAFIALHTEGNSTSAKLRSILNDAERRSNDLAGYDKVDLAAGEFTPSYAADDAFVVYYKTADGHGFGEDLPFPAPPEFKTVAALRDWIVDQGYIAQLIEEPEFDFTILWAAKRIDKCQACKLRIKHDLEEILQGILK